MVKTRNRVRSSIKSDRSALERLEPRILMDGEPIQVEKTATQKCVCGEVQVTYNYSVFAAVGGTPFSNIRLVDDNGTASYTGDDFKPTYVGGDTNNNGLLEFGETWKYTKKVMFEVNPCKDKVITNVVKLKGDAVISGMVMTVVATDSATVVIDKDSCRSSYSCYDKYDCYDRYDCRDYDRYDCKSYSNYDCRDYDRYDCNSYSYNNNCYSNNYSYSNYNNCYSNNYSYSNYSRWC